MNPRSLVAKTLDALMEGILATEPGASIAPQETLARQLGVSRTVLREALSKLEYLNVISVRPKTGSRVNPASEWRVINDDVLRWRLAAGAPFAMKCEPIDNVAEA